MAVLRGQRYAFARPVSLAGFLSLPVAGAGAA